MADALSLRRPDDWHVHLRDGALLQAVAPDTARVFARAIVMPNLQPPITTVAAAAAYRERIRALGPTNHELHGKQAEGGGAVEALRQAHGAARSSGRVNLIRRK